jgi:hypothetical protein
MSRSTFPVRLSFAPLALIHLAIGMYHSTMSIVLIITPVSSIYVPIFLYLYTCTALLPKVISLTNVQDIRLSKNWLVEYKWVYRCCLIVFPVISFDVRLNALGS